MLSKSRFALPTLLSVCLILGCGSSGGPPSTVSGKVTYKGAAVTGGHVTFFPKGSSTPYQCQIQPNGTYDGHELPMGEMDVTVETESLNPAYAVKQKEYGDPKKMGNGMGQGEKMNEMMKKNMKMPTQNSSAAPLGTYVAIPKKYNNAADSKLTKTLGKGNNKYDIELKDD